MADQAHEWTDEQIEALRRKFRRTYSQAAREMRTKLDDLMADFDTAHKDWLERLRTGKATHDDYDAWLKQMSMDRSFISGMADTLATDAVDANRLVADYINDRVPMVYAENANRAAFEVESGIGYDTHSFDLYDQSTVRRLIAEDNTLVREVKPDRAKDVAWNRQKFNGAITQSILQGESIPNTAKRLRAVLSMNENAAVMAARTAITCAENAGRTDSYKRAKRLGIELEQEWMATLDQRTRHSHRELDGQHVPVGEKFKVDGIELEYPGDPTAPGEYVWNCRCTLVAWFPDIEQEDPERWSKLPKGMTYDEWKSGKKAEAKRKSDAGVVDGEDILGTWSRRKDKFDFEIEDVLNAQGFDGKPRVVSADEFDAAVKAANNGNGFIAQRTYSAPDQETLDAYRQQLYDGRWYLDCSTGGAQYGQGMYVAADYSGVLSQGIEDEMQHYIDLGVQRNPVTTFDRLSEARQSELIADEVKALGLTGDKARAAEAIMRNELQVESLSWNQMVEAHNTLGDVNYMDAVSKLRSYRSEPAHYVETMTLDPSARIIEYDEILALKEQAAQDAASRAVETLMDSYSNGTEGQRLAARFVAGDGSPGQAWFDSAPETSKEAYHAAVSELRAARQSGYAPVAGMNDGSFAAAMGYDAINAEGHGASGSYTVILNRTKLIIKEPE